MIRSRLTQAGSRERSTAAQYHQFNRCQASRWRGGSNPSRVSTSFPDSSTRCLLQTFKIVAMACPNLQIRSWYFAGSRRAETLLSKSLHVASEIHTFFLASHAWGFGTALRRATNILSSLVRRLVFRWGAACDPQGNWHVPSGERCGGIP